MGSYDCYCAICGGPLQAQMEIGKNTAGALKRRRRRLKKEQRRRAGEDVPDSDDEETELGDGNNTEMTDADDDDKAQSDSESKYDPWDEDHSYNPTVVSEESCEWLGNARALGFNASAPGITKAYISGRGCYSDYADFHVETPGHDRNDPGMDSLPCYYAYDTNRTPVFPFHEICYKILARSLFGDENVKKIDKDVLYGVMSSVPSGEFGSCLDLDYGEIQGVEQFWESVSGEEHSVANPKVDYDVVDTLQKLVPQQEFASLPTKLDLDAKVQQDPFGRLPYDILSMIIPYLSTKSTMALLQASWYFYKTTDDNMFWKGMIKRDIFPWLWELAPHIQSEMLGTVDCKRLSLWLDKITTAKFGMEGPFLGIANRRRIWGVCLQLKKLYCNFKGEGSGPAMKRGDDESAKAIMDKSRSLHMPIVVQPRPLRNETKSMQWIRSWSELSSPSKTFESFWNADGKLAGLGVAIEGDCRVFGQNAGRESGIVCRSVVIPGEDWISEIRLHISNIRVHNRGTHGAYKTSASINGVSLTLTSGANLDVFVPEKESNIRALIPTPSTHIVGLVGQIGSSKTLKHSIISRLGVLQCALPSDDSDDKGMDEGTNEEDDNYDNDDDDVEGDYEHDSFGGSDDDNRSDNGSELSFTQRQLWNPTGVAVPMRDGTTAPLWSQTLYRLTENIYEEPERHDRVPLEMVPQQVLIWAKDEEERKHLTRISTLVVVDGTISTTNEKGESIQKPVHRFVGIRAEFDNGPPRSIGSGRTPAMRGPYVDGKQGALVYPPPDTPEWDPKSTIVFDIDGPGGEYIESMIIAEGQNECKAIRLITNKGRESYIGKEGLGNWARCRPEQLQDGEILAGLMVCFADHGDFDAEKNEFTYLTATTAMGIAVWVREGDRPEFENGDEGENGSGAGDDDEEEFEEWEDESGDGNS